MSVGTIVLIAVIVIAMIGIGINGRKKQWYKVYTGDPDIKLLYKTSWDWWFRNTGKSMIFRNERGNIVGFPNNGHWILHYEVINKNEIEAVKKEIIAWKESMGSEGQDGIV